MRDHFDITLERKLESSADGADHGATGVRRIELITGSERRRRWSDDDKARIIVESFAPGAIVSEVARRNGLSPQQLFAWRREARALFGVGGDSAETAVAPQSPPKARRARPSAIDDNAPAFASVVVAASPPSSRSTHSATIEIMLSDAIVRVVGQLETAILVAVLRAVRKSL